VLGTDTGEGDTEMVTVKISETYDLSTRAGKMSFIAIHTPSLGLAKRMWGGLFEQYKFVRFASCDVAMACASTLPADPLQIGTEAGDIAPQDMFNPILYRACSNDSFNTVLNRISAQVDNTNASGPDDKANITLAGESVSAQNDPWIDGADQFALYYTLLSDDGWRKSMPQSGMVMRGLYPICFSVLSNHGAMSSRYTARNEASDNAYSTTIMKTTGEVVSSYSSAFPTNIIRGAPVRMPAMPTHLGGTNDGVLGEVRPYEAPRCMVGAIVMPPSKLNQLYYRMKVTWTLEFTGLVSSIEWMKLSDIASISEDSYATDYAIQTQSMSVRTDMVDTTGANITKIMEGSK